MQDNHALSHFMNVSKVVALLRDRGEADVRKVISLELRKAKRARSRKQFVFWTEVSAKIAETRSGRLEAAQPEIANRAEAG